MLSKKEIVDKFRDYMVDSKKILLFDANGTQDVVKLLLKALVNDIKKPINIGFISTHQAHFSEVFSKNSSSIKTDTEYVLGGHKIRFFIYEKQMLKTPPNNIDFLIVYPIENIKEKDLVKLSTLCDNTRKIIYIIENSNDTFKHIKKLLPFEITLKESQGEKYYSMIRSTVSRNK